MSFWKRVFGRGEPEPEPELDSEPPPSEVVGPPPDDPEVRLERMGDQPQEELDEKEVLALIDRLQDRGREARAIDLARRILFHHADRVLIHQRVAELLTARGDDEGAQKLLEPFIDQPGVALDLWMLAAEVAERRGDRTRALALYERIVAHDLDYPRARTRVRRLREGERHQRDLGATLMADGALTRGRYRVERELGRGGAGTVFLADDLSLGRKVALKVYHRRGRAERDRLLVEARVPAKMEHPGVVRIFDLEESLAAITMERVLGGSVRQELKKGGLTVARIERWLLTTAEAMHHVHKRGVIHRDVKPSNMLLRSDDRVVLTDFGLACERGEVPRRGQGVAEGTLAYMPPEQRAGAAAEPAMDVHAFGASMKEILTHATTAPPERFAEIAAACLRSDPAARPTVGWLLDNL